MVCTKVNPSNLYQSTLTSFEPDLLMTEEGKKWQVKNFYKYKEAELKCPHGVKMNKLVDFSMNGSKCSTDTAAKFSTKIKPECNIASTSNLDEYFKVNCMGK
jgi:hypothetical protein